jgi:hypothetical protein
MSCYQFNYSSARRPSSYAYAVTVARSSRSLQVVDSVCSSEHAGVYVYRKLSAPASQHCALAEAEKASMVNPKWHSQVQNELTTHSLSTQRSRARVQSCDS